ncbi:MAG: hypothetical protein V3T83_04260, partial [Acidobacteriota bacterium]
MDLGPWTLDFRFAALVLLLACSGAALAQDDPMQEEKYRSGLVPTHTYSSLAGLGSVDLYTGGFTVAIPLLSLPGRAGHDLNLTLAYNSKQIVRYPYLSGHAVRFYDEGYTVGRWKLNIWPQLQQEGSTYYFTSPDGAVHRIPWNPTLGWSISDDSTNIRVSGNKVKYLSGESFDFSSYNSLREVYHLDKNGNRITYQFEEVGGIITPNVRPARIIDTLGRTVELAYTSSTGTTLASLTVKNHAGADLTWQFSHTSIEIRMQEESSYDVQYELLYEYPTLLSGVTLPDGRSYQLTYDHEVDTDGYSYYFDYGTRCQLTSLVLPTGATYSFDYRVPYGFSADAAKDATASQYLEQVTVDPVGGGSFNTDYTYLPSGLLEKTIEYRADGSKREADWNTWGSSAELRSKQRIYDTDGSTELQEAVTTWGTAFHFAYPTQLTNPLGHTAQTGYNFNTGLPVSWTDANGQVTTQTYEAYNRPLKRTFADGGWADWAYWDQYNSGKYRTRVRTRRLLAGTQKRSRNDYFDGLGRLLRTLRYEGNSVYTRVLREYALCGCSGRTSKVSMP